MALAPVIPATSAAATNILVIMPSLLSCLVLFEGVTDQNAHGFTRRDALSRLIGGRPDSKMRCTRHAGDWKRQMILRDRA